MAEKQTNKERLKDITDSIEQGIREVFESEKYRKYLTTMSRFHKYSVNNQMLIYLQRPDATHVAGFNKWRDSFGRNVLKGERGIKIIAPTPFKKKIEQQKLDPDTKMPMLDPDGKVITEEKEIKIPMFKPVTVFDVSQTDGKPLPELAAALTGDVQNFEVFMEALKRSAPVPLAFEAMASNMDGYFSLDEQRIAIREGMSEVQTVCASIHEIAHSKLHNKDDVGEKLACAEFFDKPALFYDGRFDRSTLPEGLYCYDLRGSDYDPGQPVTIENHVVVNHAGSIITAEPLEFPEEGFLRLDDDWGFTSEEQTVMEFYHAAYPEKAKISRATEEIQAESISFAVCAYYGIETGENSFGYLAAWAKDKGLKELRASLETINQASSSLITDIDRHYAEIMKERGLDKEQTEAGPEEPLHETGVQEPESVTAPDNGDVPDPAISVESMNAYGYTDANMLPLTKERALQLMERDVTVYMLYTDNTEAMAFDADEVASHDGIFGVELSEWEAVKDRFVEQRPDYEKAFFDNPADSFLIYQLRRDDDTTHLRFMSSEYLEREGYAIDRKNYEAVYSADLMYAGDTNDKLNGLYQTFNINRPDDFYGHSLSKSDIVALKQDGVVSYHYVDGFGFKELPNFQKSENYLKAAEMSTEDDYGMIDGVINNGPKQTAAQIEADAMSGKPVSLLSYVEAVRREQAEEHTPKQPEKKPSVLAKLQPAVNHPTKTAPAKGAERER